jgi:hypothetical protein
MKWYWPVACDNTVKNPFVADREELNGYDEWDFLSGRPIDGWETSACFRAARPSNDGDPDDVLQNAAGLPVYSGRLQRALVGAGVTGIQFLPVRVIRPGGQHIEGFALANVTSLTPALDVDRSQVEFFGEDWPDRVGEIRSIRQVVLSRAQLNGKTVIRLANYPVRMYVSEVFVRAFTDAKCTGYSFHEVETV